MCIGNECIMRCAVILVHTGKGIMAAFPITEFVLGSGGLEESEEGRR